MNDKQIISFIETRAKKIGMPNGFTDATLHLGIVNSGGGNLYLCIIYGNNSLVTPSLLRFKKDGKYGVFKLVSDSDDFIAWKNKLLDDMRTLECICIDYEKANVPKSIKHLVVSTIIKALNTPGMALYATLNSSSEPLIKEYNNYASVCIEYDLNFDEFIDI